MFAIYRIIKSFRNWTHQLVLGYRIHQLGVETDIDPSVRFEYPRRMKIGDKVRIAYNCVIRANSLCQLSIGADTSILENCLLTSNEGNITIGERSWLGPGTYVYGNGHVVIGDDVLIGPNCVINSVSHCFAETDVTISQQGITKAPVFIENDVWLGVGCTILQGVHIGKGAIIGAGSLVTRDVEPYSIVYGVPAKFRSWRKARLDKVS